jgi:hypothetical protein
MKISFYIQLAIATVAACLAQACTSDENKIVTQQGYLSLSATFDGNYAMSDGSTLALDEEQVPTPSDCALTLATTDDQYSYTWPSLSQFASADSYMAGEYVATISSAPLNNGPAFAGSANFSIYAGQRTSTDIVCAPADALMVFNVNQNSGSYSLDALTVHTSGGRYVDAAGNGYAFFDAGETQVYATITDSSQRTLRLAMPYSSTVQAAHGEYVAVNLANSELKIGQTTYSIDSSIFDCAAPSIKAVGFVESTPIAISEGITLAQPVKMLASADRKIVSAKLTVQSPILNIVNAPSEIDLLKLSATDKDYLESVGMDYVLSADSKQIVLDYTNLLENMASYTSALSKFTLLIEDEAGVCSEPLTLSVNTQTMQLQVEAVSAATVGINKASLQISANGQQIERQDINIYTTDIDGNRYECPITSWTANGNDVIVEFGVPEGINTLTVDVYYLGLKRLSTQVGRKSPTFSVDADAYATNAAIRIDAESDDVARAIVKYADITVNGSHAVASSDYQDNNVVLIPNLQPATKYTVQISVAGGSPITTIFTTETALQVPEGDFEDWDPLFSYKQLPMGGKYSSTELSLVNRQNYTDIDVKWPKNYWASVNAKTFNKQASHHNTWYMQPSSVIIYEPQNGYKAICITSVGWDHNGEAIADYVQKHGESLPYSNVVPNVSHRSAGRLFLGSYSYNITTGAETFNEGYAFTSRPSSLNGFYMYTADDTHPADHGYVEIEILNITDGVETVIASGRAEFAAATDYKSFNVPLTYKYYNLKATQLRIMFASTIQTGTQAFEDANVPLTAHPEKGAMTGSSLWIDNLSFTY